MIIVMNGESLGWYDKVCNFTPKTLDRAKIKNYQMKLSIKN